uniref:Uncharacterized protein n=1 Tax=Acrobeloides nanus TaxID=290746 RepID=A0A914CXK0_9BILA
MDISDKKRSGRPQEVDRVAVVNAVEAHSSPERTFGHRMGASAVQPGSLPKRLLLFRALEHWLRGNKFRTIEEMHQSLTEFFDSKNRDWYRRGIAKFEEQ